MRGRGFGDRVPKILIHYRYNMKGNNMNIPFLDLKRQYKNLQTRLEEAVIKVLRSCSYIEGFFVEEFETNMRQYLNVKHVIPCANGTDALVIALRACGVGYGDEVITTPFTFFATAEAIAAIGAVPVFVDVNESDFNMSPAGIEAKITAKTKAVLPVHIFGCPCEMDEINAIAAKHKLHVVEDAAQAIGSEYQNNKIGASNNLVTFSFYPTKNLGAFGDGGMLTTNDDNLALIARSLTRHGMGEQGAKARELLSLSLSLPLDIYESPVKNRVKTESISKNHKNQLQQIDLYDPHKYFNYLIAYNSRLDAIQAAILNVKLKFLDEFNQKRAKIAALYEAGLKDAVEFQSLPTNGKTCFHQYVIRTKKKEALIKFLGEKSIGSGNFYPVSLHLQKAFDYLNYKEGDLPISEKLTSQTVCLPIFPELTEAEAETVIQTVRAFEKL